MNDLFISEDMRLAVKKGANWLDENYPQWLESIDLEALNLWSVGWCVLGQVADGYYTALADRYDNLMDRVEFASTHGFSMPPDATEAWDTLTAAWREYIEDHRE